MSDEGVPVESLLDGLGLEPWTLDEGVIPIDAVVIVRYQRPDAKHPSVGYSTSDSLGDEEMIGILTILLDRVRDHVRQHWVDDDE